MPFTTPFTIEELLDIEYLSEVQLAPNGAVVAFVRGRSHRADPDAPYAKTIYTVDVAARRLRPLTASGTGANDQPRWSPDSRRIAFLSNRVKREETQLYLISLDGGEAQALTDLRGQVDVPKWSADGKTLTFLYHDNRDPDPIVVDADPPFNRVWMLNVETRELRAVTPQDQHVFEYDLAPDGKTLVVLASPHPNPTEGWYAAQLHTVDLASGVMHQICTVSHQIGRLSWSPDGARVAFVSGVMSDEGNVSGEVYVVPATGRRAALPDARHRLQHYVDRVAR